MIFVLGFSQICKSYKRQGYNLPNYQKNQEMVALTPPPPLCAQERNYGSTKLNNYLY